jgi:hypothetical protein
MGFSISPSHNTSLFSTMRTKKHIVPVLKFRKV